MSNNLSKNNDQPLQAWTCVKCGAALPAEAGTGELVTCGYCGTPFKLPTAEVRCDGVNISGGSVTIGGSIVGRNMVTMSADIAPFSQTVWDAPDDSDVAGVSIDAEDVKVLGDVVGGSLVKAAPPAQKLGWWEKVKRLFSN